LSGESSAIEVLLNKPIDPLFYPQMI